MTQEISVSYKRTQTGGKITAEIEGHKNPHARLSETVGTGDLTLTTLGSRVVEFS